MHSPLIVSALIMFAVLFTMLGSVHVDEGKISIEPAARNVIFWKQPVENQTFDIRGPYTVDSAIENESSIIRMPEDALKTLGLNYGDNIIINQQGYLLNQTIPGEESIMRIPYNARNTLGLNVRDVISDSELRNFFKNLYAEKKLSLSTSNITITEGRIIKTTADDAKIIDIYLNDKKVGSTTGVLKEGAYRIYLDGYLYKTIYIDANQSQNTFFVTKGENVVKIQVKGNAKSNNQFPTSNHGILFYLNFP